MGQIFFIWPMDKLSPISEMKTVFFECYFRHHIYIYICVCVCVCIKLISLRFLIHFSNKINAYSAWKQSAFHTHKCGYVCVCLCLMERKRACASEWASECVCVRERKRVTEWLTEWGRERENEWVIVCVSGTER